MKCILMFRFGSVDSPQIIDTVNSILNRENEVTYILKLYNPIWGAHWLELFLFLKSNRFVVVRWDIAAFKIELDIWACVRFVTKLRISLKTRPPRSAHNEQCPTSHRHLLSVNRLSTQPCGHNKTYSSIQHLPTFDLWNSSSSTSNWKWRIL